MKDDHQSREELQAENAELRARLAEAEEVAQAIHSGAVDAVVVSGPQGEQVYTLKGAEHAYRVLVEAMNEGAATLSPDGSIFYANAALAKMLKKPLEKIIGASLRDYVSGVDLPLFDALLLEGAQTSSRGEISLKANKDASLPALISISGLELEGAQALCAVVMDLTETKRHEEAVMAERLARCIIEQAGEAIVVCDAAGRIIRANERVQALCLENPLSQLFADRLHLRLEPDGRPFSLEAALGGETFQGLEATLKRRDGRIFHLLISARPLLDSRQEVRGCVLTMTDITSHKQAEAALRESEEKLQSIFLAAPVGIGMVVNRFFTEVNQRFCDLTGYDREELLGRSARLVYPSEEEYERVGREKYAHFAHSDTGEVETRFRRKDGTVIDVLLRSTPRDRTDLSGGVVFTALDITERKQAEEELRLKEMLLDSASDSIFLHDLEGHFVYVNQAAYRDRGYEKEELLAQDLSALIAPEFADKRETILQDLLTRGEIIFESAHRRKDGSVLPVEIHARILDLGDRKLILSAARDITERKQAQEKLLKEKLFSDTIIDSLPGVFYLFDEQGRFLRWNRNFEQVSGYTREEFARLSPLDLFEGEDRTLIGQAIREVFVKGENTAEAELVTKDGRKISYFFTGRRLDMEGAPCLVGMGIDIAARKHVEAALQESEERFRLAFDHANVGIAMVDLEGRHLRVNRALCEMMGYSQEEFRGMSVQDTTHPEDLEVSRNFIQQALAGQIDHGVFVKRHLHRSGRQVWTLISSALVRDSHGAPANFISMVQDITAHKRAQAAEALSARRLQALLDLHSLADAPREQLLDFILEASLSTMESEFAFIGTVDEVEAVMTIHRWSREALARCAIDDQPIRFPVAQAESWGECIRRRQAVVINDYQAPHPGKKGLPEGHVHIRRFLAVPVLDKGRVALAAAVANKADDYTEEDLKAFTSLLNKMWEILKRREAEEAFRMLVNHAPIGIFILQDGKFKMVNPRLLEISGYSEEELIDTDGLDKVDPEYRKELRLNVIRMLKGQLQRPYEFPITTKGGEPRWVMELVVPTVYQGRRAVLGYFWDISEQKALETQFLQAQKMEAVGRLAGGVAHDFNNILMVISGRAEMAMMKSGASKPLQKDLEEIHTAVQRAADLTRQLLAFARLQMATPQVLDLNDRVSGLLKMIHRLIGEDIDLAWMPGHDLWKVKIDPAQVDQILANLLINARDAITGVGKVTIETANVMLDNAYCATHIDCVPGEYVMLSVSDDGCGMDRETMARIFEPFFTTKRVGEGTGLGLATVYGIIRQNNGTIQVYSEPGHGSTFKIYLPRCATEAAPALAATPAGDLRGGSETVLLVEDDAGLRDFAREMLENLGYALLTAATPNEAIHLAEEHAGEIHLVITDVVLPQMNGQELLQRLSARKPGLKCLFMSGYTANVISHRGVLKDGVNFLQKPFSMQELAAKVREVLES